jgi:hypothetical protein
VLSVLKRHACQRICSSEFENVAPLSGFGVPRLEMLSLSTDLVLSGWKRYACQRIRRSESEKVARVSGFGVASLVLEMLKASDEFTAASLETLCVSMDFVFSVWKRHACQRIWCSTFRHMLTFWKHCACQRL